MNIKKIIIIQLLIFLVSTIIYSQSDQKNKASYVESENTFYDKTIKDLNEFYVKEETKKKTFKMDYEGLNIPKSEDEFETFWHNPPISQGVTGTCWDFCTTSFFESEIFRLRGEKIKLRNLHCLLGVCGESSQIYSDAWRFIF